MITRQGVGRPLAFIGWTKQFAVSQVTQAIYFQIHIGCHVCCQTGKITAWYTSALSWGRRKFWRIQARLSFLSSRLLLCEATSCRCFPAKRSWVVSAPSTSFSWLSSTHLLENWIACVNGCSVPRCLAARLTTTPA